MVSMRMRKPIIMRSTSSMRSFSNVAFETRLRGVEMGEWGGGGGGRER